VRRLFLLTALIYLSGAIVAETVAGYYETVWGWDSLRYACCAAAEEFSK
jgi:hypothetical protein